MPAMPVRSRRSMSAAQSPSNAGVVEGRVEREASLRDALRLLDRAFAIALRDSLEQWPYEIAAQRTQHLRDLRRRDPARAVCDGLVAKAQAVAQAAGGGSAELQ